MNMPMIDYIYPIAINEQELRICMNDGTVVPITTMFDWEGDECGDIGDAVVLVFGLSGFGYWTCPKDYFTRCKMTVH